jgi:hypothetical protein
MSKGISIHVGVKEFDDPPYGTLAHTISCVNDAEKLAKVAKDRGYTVKSPFIGNVRLEVVKKAVEEAAEELKADEYFLLTISSHGFPAFGSQPRAWCFSDKKLDRDQDPNDPNTDSVEAWLRLFKPNVRVLVIANCCFAGADDSKVLTLPPAAVLKIASLDPRFKRDQARSLFDKVLFNINKVFTFRQKATFDAHVEEIAACGKKDRALDGMDPNKMTPFAQIIFDLADKNTHSDFVNFVDLIEPLRMAGSLPKPARTSYDVLSAAYQSVGPYRVV